MTKAAPPGGAVAKGTNRLDTLRMLKADDSRKQHLIESLMQTNATLQMEMNEAKRDALYFKKTHDALTFALRQETLKVDKELRREKLNFARGRQLAELRWSLIFSKYQHDGRMKEAVAKHEATLKRQEGEHVATLKQTQKELEVMRRERDGLASRLEKQEVRLRDNQMASRAGKLQLKRANTQFIASEKSRSQEQALKEELQAKEEQLQQIQMESAAKVSEAETAALKARREAQMEVLAATTMQKVCRGRASRAELAHAKTQDELITVCVLG